MADLILRKHLQHDGTLPFSTAHLKKLEASGILPKPIKLGDRLFAYRRRELNAALAKLSGE
jgi:hypothetical protein